MEDEKKRDKIQYTVPRLASLNQGDHLVSEGAGCETGTSFDTGTCQTGASADQCNMGASVVWCHNGLSAQGSGCTNGSSAQGHTCSVGSMVVESCSQGGGPT